MADISDVSGITGPTLELLKASGIETAEALVRCSVEEILARLDEANYQAEMSVRRPSEITVKAWQDSAQILLRNQPVPVAKRVSGEDLEVAGIDVSAVPIAMVISDAPVAEAAPAREEAGPSDSGALALPAEPAENPARGSEPAERKRAPELAIAASSQIPAMPAAPRNEELAESPLPPRKRRLTDGVVSGEVGPEEPPEWVEEADPSGKRFRPIEEVKKAKVQGERRNRGMSHPDAGRVRLAATITVLSAAACVIAAATLLGALVMARVYSWDFHWTIALIPLVFPVTLVLYFTIGAKVRCRLCGQKLFVPKHCRKHERAKRSVFGYTYAVARDAMLFGSYRCMLCGTKTRLRR